MKSLLILSLFIVLINTSSANSSFYQLSAKTFNGKDLSFEKYKGKVLLIVNTASKCGYTPQFDTLQKIYLKYKSKGFEVLGFPSNDFNQEDLEGKKLENFCRINYGVTFQIFRKTHVNGKKRHPVYKYLVEHSKNSGKDISWNFEKFLISKDGRVISRYLSKESPDSKKITNDIETALE